MSKRNLDGLNNAPVEVVSQAAFRLIDALQDYHRTPQAQAAAIAAVFLVLCEHLKLNPQDVFVAAKNILMDERNGGREEFAALRLYVQHEIPA